MKNSWLGTILKDAVFSERITQKKKINTMVLMPHKSLNMVRNSQNVTVNVGTYCKRLGKKRKLQSTILTNFWIFQGTKLPVWWGLQVNTQLSRAQLFHMGRMQEPTAKWSDVSDTIPITSPHPWACFCYVWLGLCVVTWGREGTFPHHD